MFTKIDARVWSDECYLKLSDDGKLLFIYILSCPHRNMIGIYPLPIPYGSFDLNWTIERFTKGLEELSNRGFIKYNDKTHIVFIKNFLKYNPLENPNQVKGAIKALDVIPTNAIDRELVDYLKTVDKPFLKPLIELLSKGLGKQEEEDVEEDEEVYVEEDGKKNSGSGLEMNEDIQLITREYQSSGFGPMDLKTKELLETLLEEYSVEWIVQAFTICVESNKRTIKYARGILNNWKTEGGMKLGGKENGTNNPGSNKEGEEVDWAAKAGIQSF